MAATLAFEASAPPLSNLDDDRDLVERACSDPDAFAVLYRKYVTDVYRYCYRRLQDRETAEDVTSQVFLNAFRAFPTLRDTAFRPGFFPSPTTRWSMSTGAVARTPPRSMSSTAGNPAETPENIAIHQGTRDIVRTLLNQLPKRDREAMELRLAGLDGLEIAQALHCSPGAVRAAHHRALERMRQLMTAPEAQPR